MSFHDINLPEFIALFAVGAPEFVTSCATSKSGRESRSLDNIYSAHKYCLKDCRLSHEQFYQFKSFFQARSGRIYSFRLKDFADFKVENQMIGQGDDITKEFNLYKIYSDQIAPFYRKITKIKKNNVNIYVNQEKIEEVKIDFLQGLVSFAEPLKKDNMLTASFEFDVCVRFTKDTFEYKNLPDGSIELCNVELIEVQG